MTALTTLSLAALIQTFFRRHLIAARGVSPHTLHAYRDAVRGLLTFAVARHRCSIVELALDHIGRDTVLEFLEHLEQQRGNAAVTRNARLAAIHSLYCFMAAEAPPRYTCASRLWLFPISESRQDP
jgi:site-specific recombinase XerD